MSLVAEPTEQEDVFSPMGPSIAYFGDPSASVATGSGSYRETPVLMSPYTPSHHHRSVVGSSSPLSASGQLASPYAISSPTSSLSSALQDLHFPMPHELRPETCPIVPTDFCMWAASSTSPEVHVYAELDRRKSHFPRGTTFLEDLFEADTRFPGLVAMHERLPCQFLHVKLPVSLPGYEGGPELDRLNAQLSLTSVQELPLSTVTTICSYGTRVLNLIEPLPPPVFLGNASMMSTSVPPLSATGSSSGSEPSPLTPNSQPGLGSATTSPSHRFSYVCPFASEFFSIFLRGTHSGDSTTDALPSYRKNEKERVDMEVALRGITVMQEFVVPSDDKWGVVGGGGGDVGGGGPGSKTVDEVSPGSAIGHVVLLIVYEFEGMNVHGESGVVTFLSVRANTILGKPWGPAVVPPSMTHAGLAVAPSGALIRVANEPLPSWMPPPPGPPPPGPPPPPHA
jgi:transcriptional enhancer factor